MMKTLNLKDYQNANNMKIFYFFFLAVFLLVALLHFLVYKFVVWVFLRKKITIDEMIKDIDSE